MLDFHIDFVGETYLIKDVMKEGKMSFLLAEFHFRAT